MKKQRNKKRKLQIFFIALVLVSTFLLIINFIPAFKINAGLTTEFTFGLSTDYAAYVNQSDPNKNYPFRLIGNSCETYIHFDLEKLPKEDGHLYFSFFSYYFYEDGYYIDPSYIDYVEINIISIEESWNVSELTWVNKPEHGEIINTVNISDITQDGPFIDYYNLQNAFDIKHFYNISEPGDLSFCINLTRNNEQFNTSLYFNPRLLWNYDKLILSYTNIISTSIIISILAGIIYFMRKEVSVCKNCGTKGVHLEKVCPRCEKKFENDLITKRLDYQRVLILLWVFIFMTVSGLILTIMLELIYVLGTVVIFLLIPWFVLLYIIVKKRTKRFKKIKS